MKRWFLLSLFGLLLCGATAHTQVLMDGYIDYQISGSRMHIFIEEITNYSTTTTDRLRLRAWASEHRWHPNRKGRLIAFSLLPRLLPFEDRDEIHLSRPLHRPRTGWYHITLTLEERTFDEGGNAKWVLHDAIEFHDRVYFRRSSDWWPPFPFD